MKKIIIVIIGLMFQVYSSGTFPTRGRERHIGLEVNKAFFGSSEYTDFGFFTLNYFIYGKIDLRNNLFIEVDFPITHVNVQIESPVDGFYNEDYETGVGNPYLGIVCTTNREVFINFGVRIPFASENNIANPYGIISNYERKEAFWPEMFPIIIDVNYRSLDKVFGADVSIGPRLWFMYGDIFDDPELFINYKFGGYANSGQVVLNFGWIGSGIFSEDHIKFKNQFVDHIYLDLNHKLQQFTPGLFIKIPVDDLLSDVYDVSIGIYGQLNL